MDDIDRIYKEMTRSYSGYVVTVTYQTLGKTVC